MRTRSIATAATAAIAAVGALAVAAQPVSAVEFTVAVEDVVIVPSDGVEEGEVVQIASRDVPADLQGLVCTGVGVVTNNPSIHPNNDLLVRSGGTQVTLNDVEESADRVTPLSGSLTLGSEVVVDLVMGPDETFSAEVDIRLDCQAPATTPPPSTAAPTTAGPTTTTTTTAGPDAGGPTTTAAPDAGGPTTTAAPDAGGPTTTAGPDAGGPTTAPPQPADRLPATGWQSTVVMLAIGTVLLGAGSAVTGLARRR